MDEGRGHEADLPVFREVGEDDDPCYVIGLRDRDDPEAWCLTFMESDVEDEQDVLLGMDSYCLVIDPGESNPLRWRTRV